MSSKSENNSPHADCVGVLTDVVAVDDDATILEPVSLQYKLPNAETIGMDVTNVHIEDIIATTTTNNDINITTEGSEVAAALDVPKAISLVLSPVVHLSTEYDDDKGYDSDEGPCLDILDDEGPLVGVEEEISMVFLPNNNVQQHHQQQHQQSTAPPANSLPFVLIEDEEIKKMSVHLLRNELSKRGLSKDGRKKELVDRLIKSMVDKIPITITTANEQEDMRGFAKNAYWKLLVPMQAPVQEPVNPVRAYAPTLPAEEDAPKKYNFAEVFERPQFTGNSFVPMRWKNNKIRRNQNGEISYEERLREYGIPDNIFTCLNNLKHTSTPVEFIDALLPVSANKFTRTKCSFEEWCKYTNLKAMFSFAGEKGYAYPDFKPFTVSEIKQHIGIYLLNGLCPSPRVEMKFQPQAVDPVNGNDFVYRYFSKNAERRHRHFKAFFCVQDPRQEAPSRSHFPNWKVQDMLAHINFVSQKAWMLGQNVSVDEQTIGFQGNHKDKLRITYKSEGDGFQCDALCQEGYTYAFYFRNHPAPKSYLDQGYSPLHSRVLYLFDTLKDMYHRCTMDNLYMSVRFVAASYKHPKKVLVAGVTRKGNRGYPKAALQEEVKSRTEQLAVRGTVKAVVLEGDTECPNMVAVSVYDTKPVHFLSMTCESIKWITKERKIFSSEMNKTTTIKYLRLNVNDNYNKEMGHVDVSDQLRNHYRFDHWQRNRKWWWSICFWGIGVLLVNAYIIYCKVMEKNDVSKKDILTQYEFRKAIALAWISGNNTNESSTRKRKQIEGDCNQQNDSKKSKMNNTPRTSSRLATLNFNNNPVDERVKKSARGSDCSLQPNGNLKMRLRRDLNHWPSQAKPNQRCALHRWAADIELKYDVLRCSDCMIHLCVNCYKAFHLVTNIIDKKDDLCCMFQQEQKEKNTKQLAQAPVIHGLTKAMEHFLNEAKQEEEELVTPTNKNKSAQGSNKQK
jgi:Transposase IS4/SAP domain